jgi:hypothetical protein
MSFIRFVTFFSTLCLLSAASAMTLDEMKTRFSQEMEKVESTKAEQHQELKKMYLQALLRYESGARRQGDLDGVQAVRTEIARVENSETLTPAMLTEPPELQKMGQVVNRKLAAFDQEANGKIAAMVTSVEAFTETRATELTRQGSIQEAVEWREWGRGLRKRPEIASAVEAGRSVFDAQTADTVPQEDAPALFRQRPAKVVSEQPRDFPRLPALYVAGSEPEGDEKRITTSTPSAQGAGSALLQVRLKLIEEDKILSRRDTSWYDYKHKSHLYVGRLEFSPIPGKSMERSLIVFDLYKRGKGSDREIIRTEGMVMPPMTSGTRWVADSGSYEYETRERDSRYSGYDYEQASADEFYGFIVSIFDQEGTLVLQRASERMLGEFARTTPPDDFDDPQTGYETQEFPDRF